MSWPNPAESAKSAGAFPTPSEVAPAVSGRFPKVPGQFLPAIAASLAIGYLAILAIAFGHLWIVDARGRPLPQDFVAFWSGGALALRGMAAAAYVSDFGSAARLVPEAHGLRGIFDWSYPPFFFLFAAPLACMPYVWAFLSWVSVTLALYAGITVAVAKRVTAACFACAAPWTMFCLITGQNGFLSAALVGSVLLTLETRPILSGLLLALLSYKPQFGVLFPIALAFGGKRTTFFWAAAGVVAWTVLSGAIFGWDAMAAFLHQLRGAALTHLALDEVGWGKLQSVYGMARWLHVSSVLAWTLQFSITALCMLAVAILWRRPYRSNLKYAGLAAAIPLATPYVFVYDLPILAVAAAFLFRDRAFDRLELTVLFLTQLCVALFAWHFFPAGLLASAAVGALVWRRCREGETVLHSSTEPAFMAAEIEAGFAFAYRLVTNPR